MWLNVAELEPALSIARDLRSASRTGLVGPSCFTANGPAGIRCLHELGISDVILDLRLTGTPQEIWQSVYSAAQLGIKGITISAFAGRTNIESARRAAETSLAQTQRQQRPYIIVTPMPSHISDAELVDGLGLRVRRKEHIRLTTQLVIDAGADGIIVDYEDMTTVRKVSKDVAQLVFAQKKPRNPYEIEPRDVAKLPSIADILSAKASHVIFDSQLLHRTDPEWCADMLTKELQESRAKKGIRTNVFQTID